jgi:hypothetical protein
VKGPPGVEWDLSKVPHHLTQPPTLDHGDRLAIRSSAVTTFSALWSFALVVLSTDVGDTPGNCRSLT